MRTSRPERTTRVARRASEPGRGRGEGAIPRLVSCQRATRRGASGRIFRTCFFQRLFVLCFTPREIDDEISPPRAIASRARCREKRCRESAAALDAWADDDSPLRARVSVRGRGVFATPAGVARTPPRAARRRSTRLHRRPARLAPGSPRARLAPRRLGPRARSRDGRRRVALAGRHRGYDHPGGGRGAIVVAPRAAHVRPRCRRSTRAPRSPAPARVNPAAPAIPRTSRARAGSERTHRVAPKPPGAPTEPRDARPPSAERIALRGAAPAAEAEDARDGPGASRRGQRERRHRPRDPRGRRGIPKPGTRGRTPPGDPLRDATVPTTKTRRRARRRGNNRLRRQSPQDASARRAPPEHFERTSNGLGGAEAGRRVRAGLPVGAGERRVRRVGGRRRRRRRPRAENETARKKERRILGRRRVVGRGGAGGGGGGGGAPPNAPRVGGARTLGHARPVRVRTRVFRFAREGRPAGGKARVERGRVPVRRRAHWDDAPEHQADLDSAVAVRREERASVVLSGNGAPRHARGARAARRGFETPDARAPPSPPPRRRRRSRPPLSGRRRRRTTPSSRPAAAPRGGGGREGGGGGGAERGARGGEGARGVRGGVRGDDDDSGALLRVSSPGDGDGFRE